MIRAPQARTDGAGSPQAQRIAKLRQADLPAREKLAKSVIGLGE